MRGARAAIASRQRGAPYTQRRAGAALVLAVAATGLATGLAQVPGALAGEEQVAVASDGGASDTAVTEVPTTSAPASSSSTTTAPPPTLPSIPSAETSLALRETITGDISPKSVVASGRGLVSAQNMMYRHTVTFYDGGGDLVATVPDAVDLGAFGIDGHPGTSDGAPVEAAYTADGRHAYVSNYAMYGEGFGPEGSDDCTPESGVDDSFVYRIDTTTFEIDQVIEVGAVPKYVAVSPDGATVLVTNWCTWDLSIIDVASATEVARLPIGRYPRGIAISPDSTRAYVSVMGGSEVVAVDLAGRSVSVLATVGRGPRHLVLSPDGSTLYVTSNNAGTVSAVDTTSGAVVATVAAGTQPRSMAISPDGSALYVVVYETSEVLKLRATDLTRLDAVATDHHPIGIAYEPTTGSVWVACYGGSIMVFDDSGGA